MALTNQPLGVFRNFRNPGGMISRQARISQAFKPNSLCFARQGSEHAEIPVSTAPRTDLLVLGCYQGLSAFTSNSVDDGSGGSTDAVTGRPQMVEIRPGIADNFQTGTGANQILAKHVDLPCYAFDDNTLYLTDLNGTLPFAGFVDSVNPKDGTVAVRMGEDQRVLFELFATGEIVPGTSQDVTVRCVITTIAAYTGSGTGTLTASANGAIGAQDTSETLAAGDLVFLPLVTGGAGGATVAKDSGVWQVVSPGGAGKFQLTRPAQMQHGALIKPDMTVRVKFGTAWGGIDWRSFVLTAAKVVDTDDPLFWPRVQGYAYTIGTGLVADGGLGNAVLYLRLAHGFSSTNQTSAHANWASTITPGQGNGVLAFTGTASDVMIGQALNW